MIRDQKIVAFTPCGRKRYMDILAAYVLREHNRGHIDEWTLFNNPYKKEDSALSDQFAAQFPWCRIIRDYSEGGAESEQHSHHDRHGIDHISEFFKFMKDPDAVYLRLDDDLVYIDDDAIPALINFRLDNPKPYLVYPTIINNARTSYHLQQAGRIPSWGLTNNMNDVTGMFSNRLVVSLHKKALDAIDAETLVKDFALPDQIFTDWNDGHISINCFAMLGQDMVEANVVHPEEDCLALWRPKEHNRQNARAGGSVVIHFAFHTQTAYMDTTGLLNDYVKLAPSLGFRTQIVAPTNDELIERLKAEGSSLLKPSQPTPPTPMPRRTSMQHHIRSRFTARANTSIKA